MVRLLRILKNRFAFVFFFFFKFTKKLVEIIFNLFAINSKGDFDID